MAFLEQLQSHKGGLIQLKAELYWYGGRGYDGSPGRICLLLDAHAAATVAAAATTVAAATAVSAVAMFAAAGAAASALLLIDGSPHWVWVAEEDVELL